MSKPLLKAKAIKLRKQGLGIKTIAYKLHVSSSTASRWCKSIKLNKKQLEILKKRHRNPYYGRRFDYILRQKTKKILTIEKYKKRGINEIGNISEKEFFIAGIALYWAEGFKKDNRLGFANSDPAMIKFILSWLIKNCKVPKKDIRLRVGLNISHKHRVKSIEKYWSRITSIPIDQFQKPYFQKFIWKKKYPNPKEYYGVLRIRANNQLKLFRKIHGWIEGLKLNTPG